MHTELTEGSIFASTICRNSKKSTIVSEIFGGVLQSDVSSSLIIFALQSALEAVVVLILERARTTQSFTQSVEKELGPHPRCLRATKKYTPIVA